MCISSRPTETRGAGTSNKRKILSSENNECDNFICRNKWWSRSDVQRVVICGMVGATETEEDNTNCSDAVVCLPGARVEHVTEIIFSRYWVQTRMGPYR